MIEKLYIIVCDTCGEIVDSFSTSSIEKAARLEKKEGHAKVTKRVNGTYHIECKECLSHRKML